MRKLSFCILLVLAFQQGVFSETQCGDCAENCNDNRCQSKCTNTCIQTTCKNDCTPNVQVERSTEAIRQNSYVNSLSNNTNDYNLSFTPNITVTNTVGILNNISNPINIVSSNVNTVHFTHSQLKYKNESQANCSSVKSCGSPLHRQSKLIILPYRSPQPPPAPVPQPQPKVVLQPTILPQPPPPPVFQPPPLIQPAPIIQPAPTIQPIIQRPVYQPPIYQPIIQRPMYQPPIYQPIIQRPMYQPPIYQPTIQRPVYQAPNYQYPVYQPATPCQAAENCQQPPCQTGCNTAEPDPYAVWSSYQKPSQNVGFQPYQTQQAQWLHQNQPSSYANLLVNPQQNRQFLQPYQSQQPPWFHPEQRQYLPGSFDISYANVQNRIK